MGFGMYICCRAIVFLILLRISVNFYVILSINFIIIIIIITTPHAYDVAYTLRDNNET